MEGAVLVAEVEGAVDDSGGGFDFGAGLIAPLEGAGVEVDGVEVGVQRREVDGVLVDGGGGFYGVLGGVGPQQVEVR